MLFWLSALYIFVTFLTITDWTLRHILIPYQWRKKSLLWLDTAEKRTAHQIYQQLYAKVKTKAIAERGRKHLGLTDASYTYGEVEFIDFAQMLEIVKPQPGDILYDLGSGAGKALLASALLYPHIKGVGIELVTELHQLSVQMTKQTLWQPNPTQLEFIQGDFTALDFSRANIVFINATCFSDKLFNTIVDRLPLLAKDSYIILTTKRIPLPGFHCIDEQTRLMSWGKCKCRIYQKTM